MGQNMGHCCACSAIARRPRSATPLHAQDNAASESLPSSRQTRVARRSRAAAERRIEVRRFVACVPLHFARSLSDAVQAVISEEDYMPIIFDALLFNAVATSLDVEVTISIGNVTLWFRP